MPKSKDGIYLKRSKVGIRPDKPIGTNNPIDYIQAVEFSNELWYPTGMVAWFMTKDRNSPTEFNQRKRKLADWLSYTSRRGKVRAKRRLSLSEKFMDGIERAFQKLDGNWFTTEKAFNQLMSETGRSPLKFEPRIRIHRPKYDSME